MSRRRSVVIHWYGGKSRLLTELINLMSPHECYLEPFGGGATVLLAKKPVGIEVYNDIDESLYDFFCVLSDLDLFEKFCRIVEALPLSRKFFVDYCNNWRQEKDLVKRVSMWFLINKQSFSGNMQSWGSSTGIRQWNECIEYLPQIHNRLLNVNIECGDYKKVLKTYHGENWLCYCDPPYQVSERSSKVFNYYENDLATNEDHEDLLNILCEYEGSVLLSCYDSNLYNDVLFNNNNNNKWEKFVFEKGIFLPIKLQKSNYKKNIVKEVVWRKCSDWAKERMIFGGV